MSEYSRNPDAHIEEESEQASKKGNKLKKATSALAIGSSLGSFLATDLFAKSKAAAAEGQLETGDQNVRVMPASEMENRNLSFQEFIERNPHIKADAEVDLALFEESYKASPEGEDFEKGKPSVFVSYMKNRSLVYNENNLSAYEMFLKKDIQDTVSYLPEAKELQSSKKAIGASINITRADRWPDYKEQELYQDGTLREVLAQKKPTASRIAEIAIGVLGRIRKTERIAREVDNAMNSQVDNIKLERVNTKADFYKMDTKVWLGEMKNGKQEWNNDSGQPITIRYGIETTTSNLSTKDPYGRWHVSTQIQTFRLLLQEDGQAIIDGGTVTVTPQGQWRAARPGEGIVSANLPALTDYEQFNELMGLETVNQAIYDLKGVDPRTVGKKPEVKQGSVATVETGAIQVLPIDAKMQQQCEQSNGQAFALDVRIPLHTKQEILLKGPTKEFKAIVFSSKQNPDGSYHVKINLLEE